MHGYMQCQRGAGLTEGAREDNLPAPQRGVAQVRVGVVAAGRGRLLAKVDARDEGNLERSTHSSAHNLQDRILKTQHNGLVVLTYSDDPGWVSREYAMVPGSYLSDDVQDGRHPVEVPGQGCCQRDGRVQVAA